MNGILEMDFGMLFSRVLFHYGFSYGELMRLPIKTFWMLNRNINRLLAEKDLRALSVAAAAQSADSMTDHQKVLLDEFENPYKLDPKSQLDEERDEEGFNELKRMAQGW